VLQAQRPPAQASSNCRRGSIPTESLVLSNRRKMEFGGDHRWTRLSVGGTATRSRQ